MTIVTVKNDKGTANEREEKKKKEEEETETQNQENIWEGEGRGGGGGRNEIFGIFAGAIELNSMLIPPWKEEPSKPILDLLLYLTDKKEWKRERERNNNKTKEGNDWIFHH